MKNFDTKITRLVSYPRTGSHWVRMILEKYLQKYCLPTSFYGNNEYWGYHLHDREVGNGDEGATDNFEKVIYLYRNPVDVVYSLLKYEGWTTQEKINEIINEYKVHLTRWKLNNNDIKKIIFIKYEDIVENPENTFSEIINFLGEDWDKDKLMKIYSESTHKNLSKNINDENVIDRGHFSGSYKTNKHAFTLKHGKYIMDQFKELL